jgi:hypothetical protein
MNQLMIDYNQFIVDVSACDKEVTDFLHAHGIVETCVIHSSKQNWFRVYHYIQLCGSSKLKYLYVKECGAAEGTHKLQKVSVDEFKKLVTSKLAKQNLN